MKKVLVEMSSIHDSENDIIVVMGRLSRSPRYEAQGELTVSITRPACGGMASAARFTDLSSCRCLINTSFVWLRP
jgi:hypothetical protein